MNQQLSSYFFKPRFIPEKYEKGFNGYRTLVVGVFHICEIYDCKYMSDCIRDSKKYDSICPEYVLKDPKYYRLSNSNWIEIDSYLESSAKYPTYNSITKFLLKTNLHVADEAKNQLWNSIAFTNYLQNYHNSASTLTFSKNKDELLSAIQSFITLLNELNPEVIYVIDDAVSDCLRNSNIEGLTYFPIETNWTLPVHKFLYKIEGKKSPDLIYAEIADSLVQKPSNLPQSILKIIDSLRFEHFNLKFQFPQLIDKIRPHIWDDNFEAFLYSIQLKTQLSNSLIAKLESLMNILYENEYILSPSLLIFNPKKKLPLYIQSGIVVEIMNKLNIGKSNVDFNIHYRNIINEFDFVKALGIKCKDERQWRDRKKEYIKHEISDMSKFFTPV